METIIPRRSRSRCLLATHSPDRALAVALRQHLAGELPEVEFTLDPHGVCDVIWLCGYEPGRDRLVRALRRRHPEASFLVTGREPVEAWRAEVAEAGADLAFAWPLSFERLGELLRCDYAGPTLQGAEDAR